MKRKQLKIAVFHNLPAGGAIRALQDNLSYLKECGHSIDVYTTDWSDKTFAPLDECCDNQYIYKIQRSTFRKIIFKSINKIFNSLNIDENSKLYINLHNYEKTLKIMAKDIDEGNYDLVFLEQDTLFCLSSPILKYINTLKVYYCPQPARENEKILLNYKPKKTFCQKLSAIFFEENYVELDAEMAQFADYILSNSYFTHESILRSYGKNSYVSYLGVDVDQFSNQDIPRKNIVLSVGAVGTRKGIDFIIKSIAKVDKDIRPKFLVVGYGTIESYVDYLHNLANELDVEFEILSGLTYDELISMYNMAKLVIFAPYLEPFGLVPLESFACGTPVIGVKEGGIKETVKHGEVGLLLDRDEQIFANGITELLTNQELWEKFSENGPKYVDDFWTTNHAGERLLNNIYRILNDYYEGD